MHISEQAPFGASITRKGDEPPAAVSVHGWRYHHIGIPTNVPRLKQSRQIYRTYQEQIAACDEEIEKLVVRFEPRVDPDQRPLPPDRKQKHPNP